MPFDRENGERLEGYERSLHVVIEPRVLAEMSNFRTMYETKGKFRKRMNHRPVFDDAVAHAIAAFAEKGALRPIRFNEDDVLVQVYPRELQVAVMFQRMIAGKEYFAVRTYPVPAPILDSLLVAAGKALTQH